ncbi:LysR substrate-binding domain-containing protein [Defluviimonas sp. WL0050]|uniref:LysR substrate-binding domain-containing protein n=1 Tax=Albidovulum litorale TaxID=2984134 RepID=A0ABT2ZT89_9RHOB|nr:LysR substrate-binding domain-containing protein [Defluviimonas sp. WL0050]MCV2874354.1 LysR substrate-binding domain-containing protein [Defluviimonas sp. WL0050]
MSVAPPPLKGLPLNALRAFEAAARLGGFAAAGVELGVTAGSVAAHVKALEETLGAALFERHAKGVRLSALGQRVLPAFTDAFDQLGLAVQTLRVEAAPRTVHIATLPSIAQLWLSPRLPALRRAAPEITVSITAMEHPPDLKRSPFDLNLFFLPKGEGRVLEQDEIFPVCAPALAGHLKTPGDLAALPCLIDSTWSDDWRLWTEAAGLSGFVPKGPVFSLYALAVEEAVNGAGVLIGHRALVRSQLESGALVAPFGKRLPLDRVLSLWSARAFRPGGPASRVVEWLAKV